MNNQTYHPVRYFTLTYLLSWIPWLVAAWFSYQEGQEALTVVLSLVGLLGPFIAARLLVRKSPELSKDYRARLLNFRQINLKTLPVTLLLMPCVVLLSTALSLLWGRPDSQFNLSEGLISMIPVAFLAATFEELGWRGYGVDSLRSKFNLFTATAIFAVLWALWHAPLFAINHTYQHDLWEMNPIYVVNFFVSVAPAAVILNWLYYKNQRGILTPALFHMIVVLTAETWQTEQFTKGIVTIVLSVVALIILIADWKFFSGKGTISEQAAVESANSLHMAPSLQSE